MFVICHQIQLTSIKERLLGVDNSRDDAFKLARGRLFLVEAKRLQEHDGSLASHMPEAVSQAIALAQLTGCAGDSFIPMILSTHPIVACSNEDVRFCLTNGQSWIFCILRRGDGNKWFYYESTSRHLTRTVVEQSDRALREVIQLVSEWVSGSEVNSWIGISHSCVPQLVPTTDLALYELEA